jgi:hypothetical protein
MSSNTDNGQYGGTIGVISGEFVYTDFVLALTHQQTPPGTKLVWKKSVDIVGNLNAMVRDMAGEWMWFMGWDHVMNLDLCARLLHNLARKEVDIIFPVCLKRSPPYDPVIYSHQNEDGHYVGYLNLPAKGLTEIHAAGSAGMMVKRWVFEAIGGKEGPWFRTGPDGLNEDLTFCADAREAGARLWVDPEALLGHISQTSIWPEHREDEWGMSLYLGGGYKMPLRRILDPDLAGQT